MEININSRSKPLIVVAHPDDESIFFGGLLRRFKHLDWTLVCVTDGNAEGRGAERHQELLSACKSLGIKKIHHWDFFDNYPGRISRSLLVNRLKGLDTPQSVFTHGIFGEYGHPHHQDVSCAVHEVFGAKKIPVWSVAYNSLGESKIQLDAKEFQLKMKILQEIYGKETNRFLNILKCDRVEYFHKVDPKIVLALYDWIVDESKTLPKKLGPYAALKPFLENRIYLKSAKGFFNNYFGSTEL